MDADLQGEVAHPPKRTKRATRSGRVRDRLLGSAANARVSPRSIGARRGAAGGRRERHRGRPRDDSRDRTPPPPPRDALERVVRKFSLLGGERSRPDDTTRTRRRWAEAVMAARSPTAPTGDAVARASMRADSSCPSRTGRGSVGRGRRQQVQSGKCRRPRGGAGLRPVAWSRVSMGARSGFPRVRQA